MGSQFEKIRLHFMKALEIEDAEQREAYIKKCCEENPEIQDRLEAMLDSHQLNAETESLSDIDEGRAPFDTSVFGEDFDVEELLGEGGFGIVFRANQRKPIRRVVALKAIKPGMDSEEVIQRFRMEQNALAIMNHPGIAKVHDSGKTTDHRPFFVMEYVQGKPITDYCDEHELSISQRLTLFCDACHAIAHAHQKGVIHRDLKPSNILVSEFDGVHLPKVIDFGIAKALTPELKEDSFQTEQFLLVGSPLYMSPEQAGHPDFPVDTRTDIYSMGSLLYQLITGVPVFDPDQLSKHDLLTTLDLVRSNRIPKMSGRFASLNLEKQVEHANNRSQSLVEQKKVLEGDLSSIVSMATECNPKDRYQTILELENDVRNFLEDRPIRAMPHNKVYLAKKFVQRNSVGVSVTGLITLSIVFSLFFSIWQLNRARIAEGQLKEQLNITKFARKQAFESADEAEQNKEKFRKLAYYSEMGIAANEKSEGDIGSALKSLALYLPDKNETANDKQLDLRGYEWYFLRHLLPSSEILLEDLMGFSYATFLPGKKRIAIGHYNGQVSLFDVKTGKIDFTYLAHTKMVNGLHISQDGKLLASAGDDGVVCICDIEKQKVIHRFTASSDSLHRALIFDDSKKVITSDRNEVNLWDLKTGQKIKKVEKLTSAIKYNLDISSDYSFALVRKNATWLSVLSLAEESKVIKSIDLGKNGLPRCLSISPDDRLVATGNEVNFDISVYDLKTGRKIREFAGHLDDIEFIAFHPNGKLLASADKSGVIRFWDLTAANDQKGTDRFGWPEIVPAHELRIWSIQFSPDGNSLISASKDGLIRVWEPKENKNKMTVSENSDTLYACWVGDCKLLLSEEKKLTTWDISTGDKKEIKRFKHRINSLAFDELGSRYAVGFDSGKVSIFDALDHKLLESETLHNGSVNDVAFSEHKHDFLISTGSDDRVVRWDIGGDPKPEAPEEREFGDIAIAKDGTYALLCFENNFRKWKFGNVAKPQFLVGHENTAECLSICDRFGLVVTGSDDRSIRVWDMLSGKEIFEITGHRHKIQCLDCAKYRRTIVAGDDGGFLSFSNSEFGRFIMRYDLKSFWPERSNIEMARVTSIQFSPDGSKIAVAVSNMGFLMFDLLPAAVADRPTESSLQTLRRKYGSTEKARPLFSQTNR